jgi:hypothetical protein
MKSRLLTVAMGVLFVAACQKGQEPPPAASPSQAPAAAATEVVATPTPAAAPVSAPAAPPQAAPEAGVLAAQETNWEGIVAEVTEFRRKGNTLTARVRFRNQGSARVEPDFYYSQTYLLDTAAGKKYEVLKDEQGRYIAALRSGYSDRWYDYIEAGQAKTVWMKFPAPPAEVGTATLQIPQIPPFEDLAIQDG